MAEVFEDSYSAEALANMENYIIGFGSLIKDVGSGEAFKNALFGMKVMIDNKPRRVADLSKIYPGHRPMTLELLVFSRDHIPLIVNEIKSHGFKKVTSCAKGIINHQRQIVLFCYGSNALKIGHIKSGVTYGF